jgi:hypothetical protein
MNYYGGVDIYIHVFLKQVFFGEWSASGPGRFTPGESCAYAKVIDYCAMNYYGGVDA